MRTFALAAFLLAASPVVTATGDRPRLIVCTDIGQDPDDLQSFIRLLLYANNLDIVGLIATADNNSPREPAVVRPDLLHEAIHRYREVWPSLRLHDWRYPAAHALAAVVRVGNSVGGVDVPVNATIGAGRDTPGSDLIIAQGDRDESRPLNIALWGGAADLAQALWRLRASRPPSEVERWVRRLRVFGTNDQDSTNAWIRKEFPALFYIRARAPVGGKFDSGYRGMFLGGDYATLTHDWMQTHLRDGQGPLLALYPPRAWTQANPHGAIKEGDTPSFLYFLQLGLQDPGQPAYGGWGGRYEVRETYFEDSADTVDGETSYRAAVWRWRQHFQNDFAARADWCVRSFSEANHAPIVLLNGDRSLGIVTLGFEAVTIVRLSAAGSVDPDGDRLSFRWWFYPEAGTLVPPTLSRSERPDEVQFTLPSGLPGDTLHLIVEVTDDGTPSLTSYRRVVLSIL